MSKIENKDKNISCLFTGHRDVRITSELIEKIENEIIYFIKEKNVSIFLCGGAEGFDIACGESALRLKPAYNLKLILALPYFRTGYVSQDYAALMRNADDIFYTSKSYSAECFYIRNKFMVDNANYCLAYFTGNTHSGTGQTVAMARKKCSVIYNIYNEKKEEFHQQLSIMNEEIGDVFFK